MYTELANRILWFDGTTETIPEEISKWLRIGVPANKLAVTNTSKQIDEYNNVASADDQILPKRQNRNIEHQWTIPPYYLELDVFSYILDSFENEKKSLDKEQVRVREHRIATEFALYAQLKMIPVLRSLIYIINTLRAENIVWGVGRGSSVASYVLYLIGVHDIDSVKFGLDLEEFITEE